MENKSGGTAAIIIVIILLAVIGAVWYAAYDHSREAPLSATITKPVNTVSLDRELVLLDQQVMDMSTTSTTTLNHEQLASKAESIKLLTPTERSVLATHLEATSTNTETLIQEVDILLAVDRINTIARLFTQAVATTTEHIEAAQTSAMNAQNLALSLKPAGGNTTTEQTNLASLRSAMTSVRSAAEELHKAREELK